MIICTWIWGWINLKFNIKKNKRLKQTRGFVKQINFEWGKIGPTKRDIDRQISNSSILQKCISNYINIQFIRHEGNLLPEDIESPVSKFM